MVGRDKHKAWQQVRPAPQRKDFNFTLQILQIQNIYGNAYPTSFWHTCRRFSARYIASIYWAFTTMTTVGECSNHMPSHRAFPKMFAVEAMATSIRGVTAKGCPLGKMCFEHCFSQSSVNFLWINVVFLERTAVFLSRRTVSKCSTLASLLVLSSAFFAFLSLLDCFLLLYLCIIILLLWSCEFLLCFFAGSLCFCFSALLLTCSSDSLYLAPCFACLHLRSCSSVADTAVAIMHPDNAQDGELKKSQGRLKHEQLNLNTFNLHQLATPWQNGNSWQGLKGAWRYRCAYHRCCKQQ